MLINLFPKKYPNIPPKTEDVVETITILNAFERFAKSIGIIRTSGGIGKTELSKKQKTLLPESEKIPQIHKEDIVTDLEPDP